MAEKAISILNSAEQSFESNNNTPTQKIQQQQQHGYGYNATVFQYPPQQQRGHNATVSAHSLPRGPSAGVVPTVTGMRFPGPPQLYLPSEPVRGSIGLVPAVTRQRPPEVLTKKGMINTLLCLPSPTYIIYYLLCNMRVVYTMSFFNYL